MLQRMIRKNRDGEAGFTLVELLIVVAIIAILAAIAIPQFTKYRLRGYKSEIDSDTKNAYTAAQVYLTDNPAATIGSNAADALAKLKDGGYQPSANVSVDSADMTISGGSITLKHSVLDAQGEANNSTVQANGKFNFVPTP